MGKRPFCFKYSKEATPAKVKKTEIWIPVNRYPGGASTNDI